MHEITRRLRGLGQSLWLDGADRTLLRSGAFSTYIAELSVTGLSFNPAVFVHAMVAGHAYDDSIRALAAAELSDEEQFFELALEDLTQAAEWLRPIFDATAGKEGWVSIGLSPLLADNAVQTSAAARRLASSAALANLFVRIPGTREGLRAVEELIVDGVAVDVSLLFSPEHCVAATEAYMRGLERRLTLGLDAAVCSVASIGVSRWDVMVKEEISTPFHNRLGIAMAMRTYRSHCDMLASSRWKRLEVAGAQPQRLLWSGTATSDPTVPATLYVEALVAGGTIDSVTEQTLLAYANQTAATPMRCSRNSGMKASTTPGSRSDCSATASSALRLAGKPRSPTSGQRASSYCLSSRIGSGDDPIGRDGARRL